MSRATGNRKRSEGVFLFKRVWPTLLLAGLLILNFTWGSLVADSEDELSLAQGREPVATTNASGEVMVLWESPDGGLAGQALDPWGAPQGHEFPIPGAVGTERRPSAAWLDNEQVVIAWESPKPSSGITVQQFGSGLGANFLVASGEPIEIAGARYPALAAGENEYAVAWTSTDGPPGQHYVAFFDRETVDFHKSGLGANFRVGTPGAVTPPGIAIAEGTGHALVVWEDAGKDIMAAAFEGRSGLGANFRVNTTRQGWHSSPTVAATLDGDFLVVWEQEQPNGERYIYGSRVARGGSGLGANFRISASPSFGSQRPSLAADPWARQIVTWSKVDKSGAASIMAQSIFLDGSRNGPAFRVDAGDPFPGAPRVTRGGQGTDFVVLWEADETSEAPDIRVRFLTGPYDLQE